MRTTVPRESCIYRCILICCAAVTIFSAATLSHSQTAGTASIQGVASDELGRGHSECRDYCYRYSHPGKARHQVRR